MTTPRTTPQIDPELIRRAFTGKAKYPDDAKEFREQYLRFLEHARQVLVCRHYISVDLNERAALRRRIDIYTDWIAETRSRIGTEDCAPRRSRVGRLWCWLTRRARRRA